MAGVPPPYYGPRKKSNTTTIVLIVLGVCAVCCVLGVVGIGAAGLWGFNRTRNMIGCTLSFAIVTEAMRDYSKEHDDKLPDAATWQDEVRPYFAKEMGKMRGRNNPFQTFDPKGDWVCTDDSTGMKTGIAFNTELSGKKLSDIKNKSTTIMLFETPKTGANLNMPYEELDDNTSPKIMNQPRGWIKVTVNGDLQEKSKTSNVNINNND